MGKGNRLMLETYVLLINAGVAGIFAVFAIVLVTVFIKHLDRQNAAWRKFLREEANQRDKMIDTLTELTVLVKKI